MLHERIPFKDLDGNDVQEDFYFNLNAAELAELEVGVKGGYKEHLERVLEANDRKEIVAAFKKILLSSVGRRSEDNRRFLKTEDIVNDFQYSGAYEVMFFKLMGDGEYAAKFVNSVFPMDAAEKIKAGQGQKATVELPTTPAPTPNLSANPEKEFQDFLAWKKQNESPLGIGQ